jgi:hypothetical protein
LQLQLGCKIRIIPEDYRNPPSSVISCNRCNNVFSSSGGSNSVFYIARENGQVIYLAVPGFIKVDGKTLYGSNGLPFRITHFG